MHKFYFNDCLPSDIDLFQFNEAFSDTIKAFSYLKSQNLNIDSAVITEKLPSNIQVGLTYTLKDAINNINDRTVREIAYQIFDKSYPILHIFNTDDEIIESVINHSYSYGRWSKF